MLSGQVTTLTRANKNTESLRTTVPSSIIKQFGLEDGDKLIWKLEPGNKRLVIKVEPRKSKQVNFEENNIQ
mgnify:FL=1|jgi:bifunctional DNA-binding transcriptional regulator/antitoxin component of YhaV-PrlF toxin-antitoxin module